MMENLLTKAGIKPTPNRVLVLKALHDADAPKSLVEIETDLQTLDRSSILRVLILFLDHGIIHAIEDGRGIAKYEICHASHSDDDDMHVHFYCERCHRTYCFEDTVAPRVPVPEGYQVHGLNYMLKGVCRDCKEKS